MDEFSSGMKAKDGQLGGVDAEIDAVCVRVVRRGIDWRRPVRAEQLQDLREGWNALLFRPGLDLGNRKLQHLGQMRIAAQPQPGAQRSLAHPGVNQRTDHGVDPGTRDPEGIRTKKF
ncbi:MAG: hypothetical protein ACN6RH_18025 [Stenotrophomonas rhizophila]|uniref:hypothetical protein n=1 Tax=Stenotrophomonas rhizophila TaxID=216778 RepID=UPI003D14F17D